MTKSEQVHLLLQSSNWHRHWPDTLEYTAWNQGWDQAEKEV